MPDEPPDISDYLDASDDSYEDDDDAWAEMECSMDRHGQCGQAGSEFCDFECPVMRDLRAEERAKAARRREKGRGPRLPMKGDPA